MDNIIYVRTKKSFQNENYFVGILHVVIEEKIKYRERYYRKKSRDDQHLRRFWEQYRMYGC